MKRLLKYLKPHKWTMTIATVLVLFIIGIELYRPIIIGDAIDDYINGYYQPYVETTQEAAGAVSYGEIWLTRNISGSPKEYYQIMLYQNHYYMAEHLTEKQCEKLKNGNAKEIKEQLEAGAQELDKSQLRELRKYDFSGILKAAALYLLVLLLGFVLNVADTWMLQKMGQDIIFKMREEVFEHIHSLSLNFFNTTPVGKLVTRVSNDTEAVNDLFSTILVKLFKNTVKIIGFAVVMLSINVKMALFSFVMLPLVTGLTFFFRHMSRVAYRITRNKITELNTFLSEHISGMKLIQIFAKEKEKYQEFEQKSMELYQANWREVMTFAVFRPSIYFLSVIATVIVIGSGSYFVLSGTLSLGTLFVFISYISSFFEPIQELAEQFGTLQSSLASGEKIFSILEEKPQIVTPVQPREVNIQGKIEFRHVWFAYEKEDYILKDVSFVIEPGEKVAFVGATGAGKSSILNLIGRYFDIQKGEILIDGVNIQEIDTDVLRRAIGQVQQDVFIFTGDIKSNISLHNPAISKEDVIQAARTVHADSFIEKLPQKYDEPVTERGSTLSAGQRQLLSFARTLAYQPAILVLDEATANIDTETESLITQALETLMEGRTTIMVAHRLSTIQHADKILVMHKGEVMESGSHQELLAKDGMYKKLYDLQLVE
ncbi:ABC transporter ATP-binding protein [Roseburia sp. MSJ-14]|uniref:ABC transporter ATP-binding protein n=1 Tax=Roseburia sp. MSJ-14 TaxID=2841514 RepID=UPI001C0F7A4D|nr:ABC transporter ATP-binding protein [Roseburia sp. MSJ-14]MBU5474611.1 ABC transporter ATP-binding protein/permease [Roseburia sp. MSJ-14]